jgi:hypothetical protein
MAKSTRNRAGGSANRASAPAGGVTPSQVIMIDFNAQARQQFQEQMAEYRRSPIDRSKRRGGYFLNSDGSGAHDAEGRPVPLKAEDKEHASDLQRNAQFNRAPSGLVESDDVETTSLSEAMQGTISPARRQSASDTGVQVRPGAVEPQDLDEIADEMDARHKAASDARERERTELQQEFESASPPSSKSKSGGKRASKSGGSARRKSSRNAPLRTPEESRSGETAESTEA